MNDTPDTNRSQVVTWQSPGGTTIRLCPEHNRQHDKDPYRDLKGQEYCSVSHGQHWGLCDVCARLVHRLAVECATEALDQAATTEPERYELTARQPQAGDYEALANALGREPTDDERECFEGVFMAEIEVGLDPPTPCKCGRMTGVPCDWTGPLDEMVVIEYMPAALRSAHVAAGNAGAWPDNGALRLAVSPECAETLAEGDEWTEIVDDEDPEDHID